MGFENLVVYNGIKNLDYLWEASFPEHDKCLPLPMHATKKQTELMTFFYSTVIPINWLTVP